MIISNQKLNDKEVERLINKGVAAINSKEKI